MVPRSFFKSFGGVHKADFNADWNCQPECPECNDRRGGQLVDWPLYSCQCHYLQVSRQGDKATVEIRETTTGSERVHVINKGRTDSAKRILGHTLWAYPWGHALAYRVVVGKAPPDGTAKGFSRRLGAGHALSMIHFQTSGGPANLR